MADNTPESVAFHFMRPVPGAKPDADGIVPTEEVTLTVPISSVSPTTFKPPVWLVPDTR